MASGSRIDDLGGPIRRIFGDGTVSGMDEGELLQRFATRRDPAALEAIVVRHGPMVLGVCRRVLSNWHASEDAFQATFLVLARRASTIRDPARLGPWLHGVAHRVALRSRAEWARRQVREQTGTEEPALATASSEPDCDRAELRAAVDEEVRKLPGKFRDPIILCYLDGLTHDEAAAHLRCPVGTVRSRLSTGRARLRDRLTRRGVTVPLGVFATVLTAETASAAVSPVLLITTVRASTVFASSIKGATAAGLVSAAVASLAEGVTTTMIISKLKIVAGLALVGVMTLGVGAATAQKLGGPAEGEAVVQKPAGKPEATSPPEDDLLRLKLKLAMSEATTKFLETRVKELTEKLEGARGQAPNPIQRPESTVAKNVPSPPYGFRDAADVGGGPGMLGVGPGGARVLGNGMTRTGTPVFDPLLGKFQREDYVILHKPRSEKVAAYSTESGEWASYDVPKGVEVLPMGGDGLVALKETGDSISQVAVFVPKSSRWYPLDLKEPAKEKALPIVNSSMAVYSLGRYVYAFSALTQTWDSIELKEGAKWTPMVLYNRFTIELDDHFYIFSAKTGKWSDFDARTSQVVEPSKK